MKCLYLIQSSGKLPEPYNCLKSKDKVLLSYKENTEDTDTFFPNSTWTTGRNKLREYVIQNNLNDYDWYIFLDEDIVFEFSDIQDLQLRQQKGFQECENVLANITNNKLDFQICLPYHPFYWPRAVLPTNGELLTSVGLWFDAMFNCFTKDIFLGNDLFPYDSSYDAVSWWTSQYILMHYCKWHNIKIAQINSLTVHGTLHSEYPRGSDHFTDVKEKIKIKFTKHFGEIKWNEWCSWSEKQNIDDPDI